jgi:hypothetical protein
LQHASAEGFVIATKAPGGNRADQGKDRNANEMAPALADQMPAACFQVEEFANRGSTTNILSLDLMGFS